MIKNSPAKVKRPENSTEPKPNAYSMQGIPLSNLNAEQIAQWLKDEKFSGLQYVITPNVDHLVRYAAAGNIAFIQAYDEASIAVLDSRVLQLAIKYIHRVTLPLLPGSDLTEYLFKSGVICHRKVAIIGGGAKAVARVQEKFRLQTFFHYNPPMGFINKPDEIERCIEFVRHHQPEVLFLAVGSPRQEILAHRLKQLVDFPCKAFCIGASIDFLIGKEKRAPAWMQKLALEWLYRFIKDPKGKFVRYFVDGPRILGLLFRKDFLTVKQAEH